MNITVMNVLVVVAVIIVFASVLPLLVAAAQVLLSMLAYRKYLRKNKNVPETLNVAVIIPAWNEAPVLTASVERMLNLNYPPHQLRVYVVDDASTDNTGEVMTELVNRYGERVVWLRRAKGGEGKAHTLNYGLERVWAEDWAQAVLITDADVLFTPNSLLRMIRHFADPKVGAVTGYVKEGSVPGGYINKFVAYEYATAQAVARRAWNLLGAQMCLAGGAQLLRMETFKKVGGRIDTTTLAEDTVTTFETQLAGGTVVFEPAAHVWAEEPNSVRALWGQRLRWGRGNIQVTLKYKHVWWRWRKYPTIGSPLFAIAWFAVLTQPFLMFASTFALLWLYSISSETAFTSFRLLWVLSGLIYLLVIAGVAATDPTVLKRSWPHAFLYPGVVSAGLIWFSLFPHSTEAVFSFVTTHMGLTGAEQAQVHQLFALFLYSWLTLSVGVSYLAKTVEKIPHVGPFFGKVLLWIGGYGPLLCAVTTAAIVTHVRGQKTVWVKTVKEGKVQIGT